MLDGFLRTLRTALCGRNETSETDTMAQDRYIYGQAAEGSVGRMAVPSSFVVIEPKTPQPPLPPGAVVLPDSGPRGRERLFVDLVPTSAFGQNLHYDPRRNEPALITAKEWDMIRKAVYARADHKCECAECTGEDKVPNRLHPVEAHERWSYDKSTGVQRLTDIVALCPSCHESTHLGLANVRGRGEIAGEHLEKVNRWSREETQERIYDAFDLHEERSQQYWVTDATWLFRVKGLQLCETSRQNIMNAARGLALMHHTPEELAAAKPPRSMRLRQDAQR